MSKCEGCQSCQAGEIRSFSSGATRDTSEGKHEFGGFLSPVVLRRFGEYMTKHRRQSDGSLRDSDNWKKGMPRRVFLESLLRHILDVWGFVTEDDSVVHSLDEIEEALMAIIFNAQGLAREILLCRYWGIEGSERPVGFGTPQETKAFWKGAELDVEM